jgi:hypothetical protein
MIPINMNAHTFGTVSFWRSAAPHYGCRRWREAMRRFALQHGKAICMMADDSARIVERDESRKAGVRVHHVPADGVRWHRS